MSSLHRVLRFVSYEVLAFRGTGESVLRNVPVEVPLTITATASRGLSSTIGLAVRLAREGYDVAPHLAARLVIDREHLSATLQELAAADVKRLFVIGGDAPTPIGEFHDAHTLLQAMSELGYTFEAVGVAGYPEGHPLVGQDELELALKRKVAYASHIVTQVCFDAQRTVTYAQRLSDAGVHLPVVVGVPGPVHRAKLMRIVSTIGVGQSARFLTKQHGMVRRLVSPRGFQPSRLVRGIWSSRPEGSTISGLHIYTFNELESTERWRQTMLRRGPHEL